MIDLEYIAKGLSTKARKYKDGWITCCPAHDDTNPSLVITPGATEAFTVHCFAGCTWQAIKESIKAFGLYKWEPTADSTENWKRGKRKDDFLAAFRLARAEQDLCTVPDQTSAALDLAPYMAWAATLPPPEVICGVFQSHSSGFIAAPGGSGKSMFSLGLAKALAEGVDFCGWAVNRKHKVFIVDCEMSDPGLLKRMLALGFYPGLAVTIETSGLRDREGIERFQLGNPAHHRVLMDAAALSDVLIIDNVSACLVPAMGVDLFSPQAWQAVFELEAWARREGKLLIFIDHTNKAGQLAGTLHKHRMADFVIILERTSLIGEPWLEFLLSMDKSRNDIPAEDAIPRLVRLEDGRWSHSDPKGADDEIYLAIIEGKMTKTEAAKELDCSRTTLDKRLDKAKLRLRVKQRERVDNLDKK